MPTIAPSSVLDGVFTNRGGLRVVYNGVAFTGSVVELDDNEFHGCTFDRCTMLFRARSSFVISGCRLINDSFVRFEDAAALTMDCLAAMSGPESGMREAVLDSFQDIFDNGASPERGLPRELTSV